MARFHFLMKEKMNVAKANGFVMNECHDLSLVQY